MNITATANRVSLEQAGKLTESRGLRVRQSLAACLILIAGYAHADPQTITVTSSAPDVAEVGETFNVSAVASSNLPVTITTDGSCSGGGNNNAGITLDDTGTCIITYQQSGNANYQAAPDVVETVASTRTPQEITVIVEAPKSSVIGNQFSVLAEADSGLPVTITVSSLCQVVGGGSDSATIEVIGNTGGCQIYFNQAGNDDYEPAQQKQNSVNIARLLGDPTDLEDHWTSNRLITAQASATSPRQPITTAPMVARDGAVKAPAPNLMVVFGTGKYLEETDLNDTSVQSIYGVHDRGVHDLLRYEEVANEVTALEPRVFTEETIEVGGESMTNRRVSGENVDLSQQFGWYADLASDKNNSGEIDNSDLRGERSVFRPFLANRLFVFNTIIPVVGSCTGATEGFTMMIDWTSGLAPSFATYDATLSGSIDSADIGYIGYFNLTAGSELGRGGDNIYDSSGDEARRRSASFGSGDESFRLGWEEKRRYGISPDKPE